MLAHENDMEGALVVVEKARGLFGSTRVAYVETLAHNQFLQYQVDRRFFGAPRSDSARVDDEHPVLYVEPKGHGIEAYHGGDQLDDDDVDGFVVYRYRGEAEQPTGPVTGLREEEVGYDLVSLTETLWHYARSRHTAIYDGAFDYKDWSIQVREPGGTARQHEVSLGEVGSLLRGGRWGSEHGAAAMGMVRPGRRRTAPGQLVPDAGRNDQTPLRTGRRVLDDLLAPPGPRFLSRGWPRLTPGLVTRA